MPLTDATLALIDTALQSKTGADSADSDLESKTTALTQAQANVITSQQADVIAHQKATDDAHAALNAIAAEFGVPLTQSFTSPKTQRFMHLNNSIHPVVQEALSFGIPWGQIVQALIQGGLPYLQAWLQSLLNKPNPTPVG